MQSELACWSLSKQQRLREQLTGMWAEEIWSLQRTRRAQRSNLHFTLHSVGLKTEIQYALWQHFTTGLKDLEKCQPSTCSAVTCIVE